MLGHLDSNAAEQRGLAAMRLIVGAVVGGVVLGAALGAGASWQAAASCGWCATAVVVLSWIWIAIGPKDAEATARHAQAEDFSRATAQLVLLGASTASLIAVAFTLVEAGNASDWTKGLLIALAILTVTLAWASVHTVYTLRYADLYYDDPVGGIDFNEDDLPAYLDFAYLALTIGMTYQVSDTNLQTKPIRRTAVRHALLSFVFGAVIVAITINVVASLLGH